MNNKINCASSDNTEKLMHVTGIETKMGVFCFVCLFIFCSLQDFFLCNLTHSWIYIYTATPWFKDFDDLSPF